MPRRGSTSAARSAGRGRPRRPACRATASSPISSPDPCSATSRPSRGRSRSPRSRKGSPTGRIWTRRPGSSLTTRAPRRSGSRGGRRRSSNALVLASDDRARGLREPSPETRTALGILWSTQRDAGPEAGSWDWLDFGLEPWEAGDGRFFGATLAARAAATAPGYDLASVEARPRVDRLRDYFRTHLADQGLFNRVALLRAAGALDGLLTAIERSKLVDEALAAQHDDGGWGLASLGEFTRSDGTPEDTASDGLATGFVLDALRASGLPRTDPKVARGLDWLRRNQQKDGGWVAVSLNKKRDPKSHVGRFMSDAATAYAVLALARED